MKTLFIVMDSLNRHCLGAYGESWIRTPNIDRLVRRGMTFDRHYSGSLPCMPARREMMTGRLNFLEAPWGPVEPWDDCLPTLLRRQRGVYSHMITDHYHYFHSGGEAYHTLFDTWEFERGQEGDVWHPLVNPPTAPAGARGKGRQRRAYWVNRAFLDPEDDLAYPTPRCFARAIEFLDNNHAADNWHLHLEVFDPHEPFDCPQRYRDMYDDDWDAYFYNWPEYARLDPDHDDPAAVAHIRKCYAGTLTMADAWLGKLLDKMDELDLWKDTAVVLTTDHGHLLGEHGYWAKNYMMDYEELAHIPLVVCAPDVRSGSRTAALTATADLVPTLLEMHRAEAPDSLHGQSLQPVLAGARDDHHAAVIFGYFGKDVNLVTDRYSYCRQPLPDSIVHHHTAMPRAFADFIGRDTLAGAETGVFLKHTHGIPHFRITCRSKRHADAPALNPIHDLGADPAQEHPIDDPELETQLAALLRRKLEEVDAPECQFTRLGFPPRTPA